MLHSGGVASSISAAKDLKVSSSVGILNPGCNQEGPGISKGTSAVTSDAKSSTSSLTSTERSLSIDASREEVGEGEIGIAASVDWEGLRGVVLLLW